MFCNGINLEEKVSASLTDELLILLNVSTKTKLGSGFGELEAQYFYYA